MAKKEGGGGQNPWHKTLAMGEWGGGEFRGYCGETNGGGNYHQFSECIAEILDKYKFFFIHLRILKIKIFL